MSSVYDISSMYDLSLIHIQMCIRDSPTTADAVERLAPYFVKKGFQLVTLDEMFYYKHKDAEPGKVYFSAR